MASRHAALVTGGTGFVGAFLIEHLLRQGLDVVALARGPAPDARVEEALRAIGGGDTLERRGHRLRVIEGDVRAPGLGMSDPLQRDVAASVGEVWHCASSFKFEERSRADVVAHNVTGTQNVLDVAERAGARMAYVSTAYAAPVRDGMAREEIAEAGAPARNLYEWSKQEAERAVLRRCRERGLRALVLRPSIVLGHSETACAIRFTGYYEVTRAIHTLARTLEVTLGPDFDRDLHLRILGDPEVRLDTVPIDFVVAAMWALSQRATPDGSVFHLVHDAPPRLADLFHHACEPLGVRGIQLVGADAFEHRPMSGLERIFSRKTRFQAPYLLDGPRFGSAAFRRLVPASELPCPVVGAELLGRLNRWFYAVLDARFRPTNRAQAGVAAARSAA